MCTYEIYVLFNKSKNSINKAEYCVSKLVWKHLADWDFWFSHLTLSTPFSSLFGINSVCASIPNSLEFNWRKFMFSPEVTITYDWILIPIFLKVFVFFKVFKQFYSLPRRRCFCWGSLRLHRRLEQILCFIFSHSPVSKCHYCDSGFTR